MIEWLDLATKVGPLLAGGGAFGLAGKMLGHRQSLRRIEAETVTRIAGAYGHALEDLEERSNDLSSQLRESRADRTALHAELAMVRAAQRVELTERRTLAQHFEELIEHVRVLRTILRTNKIEHPAGPPFLDEG
jgi:predicted RNase H-like nuclease (RuvC/YqgF family)